MRSHSRAPSSRISAATAASSGWRKRVSQNDMYGRREVCRTSLPSLISETSLPTVGKLVSEINEGRDVRQTSLRPYMSFWETRFLQPLEAAVAAEMREDGALECDRI